MESSLSGFFDLASLTKPLVAAPLAHAYLDLDADRRWQLGFPDRDEALTVRQLLSHSSGFPPWLPFTGERLSEQLRRGVPHDAHPLLRKAKIGASTYSDLNFRLLAELIEVETGLDFGLLGTASSGLDLWPWRETPRFIPDGPDVEAWALATDQALPTRAEKLPHDANARAGMRGHAGFGATVAQLESALQVWVAAGWPDRMAVETASSEDGARWGLGLQMALDGAGRLGALLKSIPLGAIQKPWVLSSESNALNELAPKLEGGPGVERGWWFHLGFTGPALFYRPQDQACIALLCHRAGPRGELLDAEALRKRRWALLEGGLKDRIEPRPL
jgi:CubicO group peptidase (beta-lactamase class C family)